MERFPITREGYKRLRTELQRLEREERPRVIQAIAEAREHGDISENAEFEAAKERQGLVEGKINDLHSKLGQCEIVEVSLIGKEAGDDVRVQTPGGVKNLEILDIDYAEQS
jgi:transcription elongation factor GreA